MGRGLVLRDIPVAVHLQRVINKDPGLEQKSSGFPVQGERESTREQRRGVEPTEAPDIYLFRKRNEKNETNKKPHPISE